MRSVLVASVVLRMGAGCWLLWRVRTLGAPSGVREPCSVVIPARDEASGVGALLDSLLPQLAAADEIVVVDDHSTDGTAAVAAARHGVRVLPSPPLPPGWTGKAWACWTGVWASNAPTLVFLDADVTAERGGLGRLLAEHEERGGVVSVQPFHRTHRPYERLSLFFNIVALMGSGACTPRPRPTGAFGPVLATSRDDYLAAGGHEAVAGAILDDVALAGRYRALSLPVSCFGGKGSFSFRMYPNGIGQLVEGWTKNFAAGARATRPLALLLVVAWISVCLQPTWWLAHSLVRRDAAAIATAVAVYALVSAQLAWMARRIGAFGRAAIAVYAVPLACFLAVFARSAALVVVRGRVRWKGRDVSTRPV